MHKFQMSRVSAIAAAAALVIGSVGPAAAATRDPAPATASQDGQSTPSAKKPTRYCVEREITGSRMPQRLCKTRQQWIKEDGFDPIGELNAN